MDDQNENRKRLARLLNGVADQEGIHQTLVEGVQLARHSEPQPRTPVIYEPMIVVIGQGRKRGYLGDEVYAYDPFNYLVLSVPLPVECEWEASTEEPLLVVAVSVEPTMLGEMLYSLYMTFFGPKASHAVAKSVMRRSPTHSGCGPGGASVARLL